MASDSQIMRARLCLIAELHAGSRPPGAAISIKETAELLKLSPTPVREALARLAGEGIVTMSGDRNGFAVPQLSASGYAELIEFTFLLIEGAVSGHHVDTARLPEFPMQEIAADPVSAIEATIGWLISGCENRRTIRAIGHAGLILAPYRRVEPLVVPEWSTELQRLIAESLAGRSLEALSGYRKIRMDLATRIVDAVERSHNMSDIFRI